MSRERTVIDVALSEDQKNELYEQLMQQQQVLDRKLESEHKRHEQLVRFNKCSVILIVHVHVYVSLCVCVCVCLKERQRERERKLAHFVLKSVMR